MIDHLRFTHSDGDGLGLAIATRVVRKLFAACFRISAFGAIESVRRLYQRAPRKLLTQTTKEKLFRWVPLTGCYGRIG
jgi:hypothetical protein